MHLQQEISNKSKCLVGYLKPRDTADREASPFQAGQVRIGSHASAFSAIASLIFSLASKEREEGVKGLLSMSSRYRVATSLRNFTWRENRRQNLHMNRWDFKAMRSGRESLRSNESDSNRVVSLQEIISLNPLLFTKPLVLQTFSQAQTRTVEHNP